MSCSPYCSLLVSGVYEIGLDSQSMVTDSNNQTTINFSLRNLRNPKSSATTASSFQI